MKNKNFKKLSSKMGKLEESKQGKIKGGIVSLPNSNNLLDDRSKESNLNCCCQPNTYMCNPQTVSNKKTH